MTASPRSRRTLVAAVAVATPLAFALATACGSSSSSPPPATGGGDSSVPLGDSASNEDGQTSTPDQSSPEAGPGADGGKDSASPTGTDASDAATDGFVDAGPPAPVCPLDASTGEDGSLVLSTPDPDEMGGISSDGLVIAWTSTPDDGGVYIHWAERSSTTAAFGAPQTLDSSFGPFPPDHVSLRGDGLQILFASADHTHLYEVGRTAYGAPFNNLDTPVNFPSVNPSSEGGGSSTGLGPFASPTAAGSFTTGFSFIQGTAGLVFSQDEMGTWTTPLFPSSLSPPASTRYNLTPTGWSSDGRTLFYWDSALATERAAWRGAYYDLTFATTIGVGSGQQFAVPSSDCTQLYYSAPGSAGDLDLYVTSF